MLEAGALLVAERGMAALTLAEVGKAAGFSRGLPAHHFGSKREFQKQLLEFFRTQYPITVERPDSEPGLASLVGIVKAYFERSQEPMYLASLRIALSADPLEYEDDDGEIGTSGLVRKNQALATYERHLEAGIRNGEIRKDVNTSSFSIVLLCLVCSVLNEWLKDRDLDLAAAGREVVSIVVQRLSVHGASELMPAVSDQPTRKAAKRA